VALSPSNSQSHDPLVREEVGKQSVASGFPGNTYPLHENNCVANGGNHRGARALKVTFSTKEPSPCAKEFFQGRNNLFHTKPGNGGQYLCLTWFFYVFILVQYILSSWRFESYL